MTNIKYGIEGYYIDITELASRICERRNTFIIIPASDEERSQLFGDPVWGQFKHILVNGERFDQECHVNIPKPDYYIGNPHKKLQSIHEKLRFTGNLKLEYPEQIMSVCFIRPDDIVLEIGSNYGRNSVVISSILSDSKNLTTLECDPVSVVKLRQNKKANYLSFNIVDAALSKRPLYQSGWETSFECKEGWTQVKTILYNEIKKDYTVLVADCEGALYYIIQDFPEILNVKTIIVENDYRDSTHFEYVNRRFKELGFVLCYSSPSDEAASYGLPNHRTFFQTWKRNCFVMV